MPDPARIEPTPRPHVSLVTAGSAEPYRRLAEIFHDVLSEQSLDAVLERIADALAVLIPYEDVHIYEADEAKRELHAVLARGEWEDEVKSEIFSFGEGITGWAVDHREAVLANKAHLDPRVRFVPGTPIEPEALIAVPLVARGQLKGTLNIYRVGEDAAFSDEEFLLAKRFGDAAALAIDNAHIRARLEHQAETDALTGLYNHRAFHDRLRQALVTASAAHDTVAVVMLDLDDFKKVNDVYGHGVGDQLLNQVADVLRTTVRTSDVVCRVGGEEFAVILPSGDLRSSTALAERVGDELAKLQADAVGHLTMSAGIAVGPEHAANPRELVACAEAAMMTAKARGHGLIVPFDESEQERPAEESLRRDVRSIAHLKMLQSLSGKLSRLNDVEQIGLTISDELRLLIDYHNCRVFLRDADELVPLAFRGDLTGTTPGDPTRLLPTAVGRGITGRVAETGVSLLVDDAAKHAYGELIEGTAEIEESLLVVPLKYGARVTGVIVVSKLGLAQFDADDLRLLEVLAGHASVALENARLYEAQRREAESAKALLAFSRDLAEAAGIRDVAERVTRGAASILESPSTSVWLQSANDGVLERLALHPEPAPHDPGVLRVPAEFIEPWLGRTEPFTVDPEHYAAIAPRGTQGRFAIAPFLVDGRWGGVVAAAIALHTAPEDRELELLASIARQTRLALQTATSYETLERTFLATVEALANALEANDEHTSTHARWITDLALQVGEELGLEPHELKRLELGALFHDIGKIGIPARILAKAAPLTAEERAVVETHPILGERILAPIEQLGEVRLIVRCAHEHFDGTGYPDRLAGDRIPLESRIVLACDAYHAMTTGRPYRRSLGEDEAKRRLVEASGAQFDPQVVDALLRVLD
ncbi:MAG: diguanylate cyclase with sensor [Gaiellaceae bacterium]|jgi:diguanylate cyclase (GGDEF)-like protein|nr:diguanylate cyclase with sensor [Gaiellaceae bacterium]